MVEMSPLETEVAYYLHGDCWCHATPKDVEVGKAIGVDTTVTCRRGPLGELSEARTLIDMIRPKQSDEVKRLTAEVDRLREERDQARHQVDALAKTYGREHG